VIEITKKRHINHRVCEDGAASAVMGMEDVAVATVA
jgi:hypothetical protein